MVRADVPHSVAMSISGHRPVSMFMRYNVAADEDRRDALRRTEAYRAKTRGTRTVVPMRPEGDAR